MSQTGPSNQGWKLDLSVPVVFIATVIVNSGVAIWWISGVDSRVEANTEAIRAMRGHDGRIILLESQISHQNATLERLEAKIDGLDERLRERP